MTKQLQARIERIEARRRPAALVIDEVVIGGAPIDGKVIVIGERNPNHDHSNDIATC